MPIIEIEVDDFQRRRIIDLFNEGLGIVKIKKEIFEYANEGFYAKMPRDEKIYNHSLNVKILSILGFTDYGELSEAYKKMRSKRREDIPVKIRRTVFERDNNRCCITGRKEKLHIHHIDGDPMNNSVENLIVLSQKCHRAIHNYMIKGYSVKKLKNYNEIIQLQKRYIEYIKQHGYPDAKLINLGKYIYISIDGIRMEDRNQL